MQLTNLVRVLRENELLFADMYRECVRLFPAFAEDFSVFVREEESHAALFASVAADLEVNPGQWRSGKVSLRTLEVVQQQIKDASAEIRSGQVAPRYAITALRNFEQGMSERAVDKILETDSQNFKNAIASIRDMFVGHLTRLQELERRIFPRSATEELFEI